MERKWSVLSLGAVLACTVLAGCLPVELSVSPKGEFIIPRQEGYVLLDPGKGEAKIVLAAKGNKPAFAVFAPDGNDFAAVTKTDGDFKVSRVARDGTAKEVLTASNMTYLRWSPDGKTISITRIGDTQNEAVKENLPELIVVSADGGAKKTLLGGCSMIHRWTSDSKSILAVKITGKVKDKDRYVGELALISAEDGKATPIAAVVSEKKMFVDLSPDGKKALLVATKLGKAGSKLESADEKPQLFEVNLADGTFRSVREGVLYGMYSPKGTKVLLAAGGDGGLQLDVCDAAFQKSVTVASDAAKTAGSGPDNADIYPGWVNDDIVHYLRERAVYGVQGKNLQLMMVGADGKNPLNLQPTIDMSLKDAAK